MTKSYNVRLGVETRNFIKDSRVIASEIRTMTQLGKSLASEFNQIGNVNLRNRSISELKNAVTLAEDNVTRLRRQLENMRANGAAAEDIRRVENELRKAETQASRAREALHRVTPPDTGKFRQFTDGFVRGFMRADDQLTKIRASFFRMIEPITQAQTPLGKLGAGFGLAARGALEAATNVAKFVGRGILNGLQMAGNFLLNIGKNAISAALNIGGKLLNAAVGLGKEYIKWDQDVQQFNNHLTNTLKDGENGMRRFRNELNSMPAFQMEQVQKASKVLLTYMELNSDELITMGRGIADVSRYFSLTENQVNSFTLAFAQAQSKGRLMGDDFRQMDAMAPKIRKEIVAIAQERGLDINTKNFADNMSKGNISAELLREAFLRLASTAEGASLRVNSIGEGLQAARGVFLQSFFLELSKNINGAEGSSAALGTKIVELADRFGRFTAHAIIPMIQQLLKLSENFVKINDGRAELNPAIERKMEQAKNAVIDFGKRVAEWIPKIADFVVFLYDKVIEVFPHIVEWFKEAWKVAQDVFPKIVEVFSAVWEVFERYGGTIVKHLGLIVGGLTALKIISVIAPLIKLMTAVIGLFKGGVVLATLASAKFLIPIAAIAAGATLIIRNWEHIVNFFRPIFDTIFTIASNVWNGIMKTLEAVIKIIVGIVKGFVSIFRGDFDGVKKAAGMVWDGIKKLADVMFGNIIRAITGFVSNFGNIIRGLTGIAGKVWDGIKKGADTMGRGISGVFNNVRTCATERFNAARDVAGKAWDRIKSAADAMGGGIRKGFDTVRSTASNIFGNIGSTVSGIFGRNKTAAENSNRDINRSIKNVSTISDSEFRKIPKQVENAFNTSARKITSTANAMQRDMTKTGQTLERVFSNIPNRYNQDFARVRNNIQSSLNWIANAVQSTANRINAIPRAANNARNFVADIVNNIHARIRTAEQRLFGLRNVANNVMSWLITNFFNRVTRMLSDTSNRISQVGSRASQAVAQPRTAPAFVEISDQSLARIGGYNTQFIRANAAKSIAGGDVINNTFNIEITENEDGIEQLKTILRRNGIRLI